MQERGRSGASPLGVSVGYVRFARKQILIAAVGMSAKCQKRS